ncbi:MAG: M20/M25/M40 family metallo-hydrolase [Candidatus Calescibacterium sp.]|nr:M20/M25/M40 family metallo-hydrolase [Candidatus Calescibacterium sp.]MCX7972287.1 M20/M25/M40 family metallo-hydrolase [bacterium]MDW8195110.1 M20/M25/M40 family metallo-hydrolase [Candidatus Calescibacterium sp.]
MSEVISILLDLLRIKSVTAHEDEIKKYIVHKVKDRLFFSEVRNNIVCFSSESCYFALVGHIDTVDNINLKNGIVEDGKVFGLGASDMKAGIAIMLYLLQRFNHLPILWIFYDREEGSYNDNGLSLVFDKFRNILKNLKFAIILEPTSNNIELGCNGVINYGLWIKGKSGHSARPQTYQNPFYLSLPIVDFIANYKPVDYIHEISINSRNHKLCFTGNMVITQIKGYIDKTNENNFKNLVPEYCFINVNVRYTPNYNFEDFDKSFRNKMLGYKCDIEIIDHAPAGKILINRELVEFLEWYLKNGDFEIHGKQAWTDVARFSLFNIPAINLGPGEPSQAHQKNEYAFISKIEQLSIILARYLQQLRS